MTNLIKNRIVSKTRFPKEFFSNLDTALKPSIENEIRRKMISHLSESITNKFDLNEILRIEKDFETDFILECYVFTRDEIFELIKRAKEGKL
jgi:hypothetical protein